MFSKHGSAVVNLDMIQVEGPATAIELEQLATLYVELPG